MSKNTKKSNAAKHEKRILGANNTKGTFKRILTYLKPYKGRITVAMAAMVISVLCNIAGTAVLALVIDSYIMPLAYANGVLPMTQSNFEKYAERAAEVTMQDFGIIMGVMIAIYVAGALFYYVNNYIVTKSTTKILQNIRDEMFEKMERLPVKFFDTHTHGELMSCFTNDTDTLREFLAVSLPNMLANMLMVVGIFVMMIVLNAVLTLFIIAMLIIMLIIMKYIGGKSGKHFVNQQKAIGELNGFIEEHVDGMKVVKVFCHEEFEKADFDKKNEKLQYASRKAHTYANVLMPIMGNISYINYSITAIVGTLFAVSGFMGMSVGKLISFMQYSKQFSNPLSQMAQQMNSVLMGLAGAERIFSYIDEKPEEDEGYVELVNAREDENGVITEADCYTGEWAWKHYHKADNTTTYVKWRGEVEFENVTFGYNPDHPVLKNINLVAKPGQKIALVGSTGAGKTTITNLINRFYDITDGKIRYDNINIQKINKADLRHSLGMVLQDTHLFTGTVKDNIRFGKLDATDEEVVEAAKLANADYFIRHLPQGYDTVISGDGSNLSQGQRQLLAIARAAVANPPVLILDEATSSIDTRTEKLIEQGMDKLMVGRTVFVIAHRLSTVRNSDLICVLEHGEIIERGNHDELIQKGGKYYQLYTGAFELE